VGVLSPVKIIDRLHFSIVSIFVAIKSISLKAFFFSFFVIQKCINNISINRDTNVPLEVHFFRIIQPDEMEVLI